MPAKSSTGSAKTQVAVVESHDDDLPGIMSPLLLPAAALPLEKGKKRLKRKKHQMDGVEDETNGKSIVPAANGEAQVLDSAVKPKAKKKRKRVMT